MKYRIGEICSTVSETYKGKDPFVVLINTSDVLKGFVTNHSKTKNEKLAGQFKKTFKKDDILYSEIRPANRRYAYVDFDDTSLYIASTKLMVIRANTSIVNSRFLFYLLTSEEIIKRLQHLAETRSGTFPQITFSSEISPIEVDIPSLEEQNKIVDILRIIDEKTHLNDLMNTSLEEQISTIFKERIARFDNVPDDWNRSSLDSIADYLNGLPMQKHPPKENDKTLPVLKIAELKKGFCDETSDRCSTDFDKKYLIHDGDVVFSWSASLFVDIWCGGLAGLNQHLFKVTSSHYDRWFYYCWTKYHLDSFIREASAKATTMGHITRDRLTKAEVLIPDKTTYNSVGGIISSMIERIILNRFQNNVLIEMKSQIQKKLLESSLIDGEDKD